MNYKRLYERFVYSWQHRDIPNGYVESHHILPSCMGGDDDENNLVLVTPREHYIAHLLLAKTYPEVSGLWVVVKMMTNGLAGRNNRLYDWVRRNAMRDHSICTRDGWARKRGFVDYDDQCVNVWKLYVDEGLSASEISNKFDISSNNVHKTLRFYADSRFEFHVLTTIIRSRKIETSKKYKANFTHEQETRRISACRNSDYTERNRKMSKLRTGAGNPVYGKHWKHNKFACTNCLKIVGGKRWHNENCIQLAHDFSKLSPDVPEDIYDEYLPYAEEFVKKTKCDVDTHTIAKFIYRRNNED